MVEWQLKQRQSLPLEMKIIKSIRTLEKYYEMTEGQCYISVSGLDSNIVRYLGAMSIYNFDCVTNASLESPSVNKLNIKRGTLLLKSNYSKMAIIEKYGYPLISKSVAMMLSRYHRTKSEEQKEKRLNGYVGRNGNLITNGRIPFKYQHLIYAPFEFSEKCCDFLKKKPLLDYEKETGNNPITGETAEESRDRKFAYLKYGCIQEDKKRLKCTPLATWTTQDKLEFINQKGMRIPSDYGEIVEINGELTTTGEKRTGCDICGFGLRYDLNRFTRLQEKSVNNYINGGGKWIRKDIYRFVRFRPNSILIYSNLYFVPSKEGYGYKFVIDYLKNTGTFKE